MRVLVLDSHPDAGSFGEALANAYLAGVRSGGHQVRLIRLRDLRFDPILHGGFRNPQPQEPDLRKAAALIRWCEHLTIVTPNWWWNVPALLKGFVDRVFLPGFSVDYLPKFPFIRKLLRGRSARVIYTQNSAGWLGLVAREDLFWRWAKRAFLGHCGFRPIRRTLFADVSDVSEATRRDWLAKVERAAQRHP